MNSWVQRSLEREKFEGRERDQKGEGIFHGQKKWLDEKHYRWRSLGRRKRLPCMIFFPS